MVIEKWRPAKAGDEGRIARFWNRDGTDFHVGVLTKVVGGEWYVQCEVLEAYMSDDEVERLAGLTEQAIVKASIKNAANIAGSIRQHFASEKGGE